MKNGRILLVEDHPMTRSILATKLEQDGYEVRQADCGQSAFNWLNQEPIDLVLLDLGLPDIDGFQVLAHIKADNNLHHIPVIVVSGADDVGNVVQAIEMGATDFLTKPVNDNLLAARLTASLASKRLHDLEQETQRELHAQKVVFQQLLIVAQIVSQSHSLEETLENVLRASMSLTKAARSSLFLVDPDRKVTAYILNHKDELITGSVNRSTKVIKKGLGGWVFQNQRPVLIKDTREDERWIMVEAEPDEHWSTLGPENGEARSALCVPVSYQRDVLGILTLTHPEPNYFQAEALGLLQAAADQMAMTLYNARLYEEQRRLVDSQNKLYKALQESESQYRDLFDNAHELIQGVGENGRFQYVNHNWQTVLGYSAAKAQTMAFEDIIYPDELPQYQQTFQRIARGEQIDRFGTSFITKAGERIYVEGSLTAQLDESGNFLSSRGIFHDITDRKKAEEALQTTLVRTEALYQVAQITNNIQSSSDLLQSVVTVIATALPANRVALLLFDSQSEQVADYVKFGFKNDDILEIGFPELMDGLSGWVFRHKKPAFSSKNQPDPRESKAVQQRRLRTNSGSIIVVPLQYREQVWGTITAINNLDEADFSEEDVNLMVAMASQVTVAVENVRLYAEEKKRVRELQAYVEELDMFAGAVAHDLKSPLTSVIGFSDLLRGFIKDEMPLSLVNRISDTGHKMDALINELLLLAKVRQSEVSITSVNMRDLAVEAVQRLDFAIEESQAAIIWMDGIWPQALGYPGWLEEVWVNYISNAIKYGGHPPKVMLGADQPQNGTVRYWVQDDGLGLSAEDQTKLFSRFERLDQINIKGHGLGLAIVKRIVEKLGGQVGVESEPGKGSLFYFILPTK